MGRREGGFWLPGVMQDLREVWLVEKILACGWEEQVAGCQEKKKKMWDMVLVVEKTANHHEGG